MKKLHWLFIIFLILTQTHNAQISFSKSFVRPFKPFHDEDLKRFASSTMVFVIPNYMDKKEFEKAVKGAWNATAGYVIVHEKDYKDTDYLSDKYSFSFIEQKDDLFDFLSMHRGTPESYFYVTLKLFDTDKFKSLIEKRHPSSLEDWLELREIATINIARFHLIPTYELQKFSLHRSKWKTYKKMYNEKSFYLYEPGYLRNFFQKISRLIENKEYYIDFYKNYDKPELKNLKTKTLYIPSYIKQIHTDYDIKFKPEKIFKNYPYKYQFISDDELNKKILNGGTIYYLRFNAFQDTKYVDIVNARTGEIISHHFRMTPKMKMLPVFVKIIVKRMGK